MSDLFEQVNPNDYRMSPDLTVDPISTYNLGSYYQNSANFATNFSNDTDTQGTSLATSRYSEVDNFLFFNLNKEFFYTLGISSANQVIALTNLTTTQISAMVNQQSIYTFVSTPDGPDYPTTSFTLDPTLPIATTYFTQSNLRSILFYTDQFLTKNSLFQSDYITSTSVDFSSFYSAYLNGGLNNYLTNEYLKAGFYNNVNIQEAAAASIDFVFINANYFSPFAVSPLGCFPFSSADVTSPKPYLSIYQYLCTFLNQYVFLTSASNVLLIASSDFSSWRFVLLPVSTLNFMNIFIVGSNLLIQYGIGTSIIIVSTTNLIYFTATLSSEPQANSYFQDEYNKIYFVSQDNKLKSTNDFITFTVEQDYSTVAGVIYHPIGKFKGKYISAIYAYVYGTGSTLSHIYYDTTPVITGNNICTITNDSLSYVPMPLLGIQNKMFYYGNSLFLILSNGVMLQTLDNVSFQACSLVFNSGSSTYPYSLTNLSMIDDKIFYSYKIYSNSPYVWACNELVLDTGTGLYKTVAKVGALSSSPPMPVYYNQTLSFMSTDATNYYYTETSNDSLTTLTYYIKLLAITWTTH